MTKSIFNAAASCLILAEDQYLLPLALPHHEVVGELEHVEDELLELDAVVGSRSDRLLVGIAVERDLLFCDMIRQLMVMLVANLGKKRLAFRSHPLSLLKNSIQANILKQQDLGLEIELESLGKVC